MKDRILYLRKTILNLSRTKFGEPIGMSDSEIKNIENGFTQLKENKIPLICNAYNVNEKWLRGGTGEVFLPKTRDQEINEIVKSASQHDPEEAAKFFTTLFADMTDAEIILMYEIFVRHFPAALNEKEEKVTKLYPDRRKNLAAARSGDHMESNQVTQEEADSLLSNPCIGDI